MSVTSLDSLVHRVAFWGNEAGRLERVVLTPDFHRGGGIPSASWRSARLRRTATTVLRRWQAGETSKTPRCGLRDGFRIVGSRRRTDRLRAPQRGRLGGCESFTLQPLSTW